MKMKEIKVGDRFRGKASKKIITVVYVNEKCFTYEYEDKSMGFNSHNEALTWLEELPEPKEVWYQVAAFKKDQERPFFFDSLYKSKEDYLRIQMGKESDYHWIKLKEVDLE